jgi:hypothetical protein
MPTRPRAPSIRRQPIASGPFVSYTDIKALATFNRSLTYEQIDQACERFERVLVKGIPDVVRVEYLSQELA